MNLLNILEFIFPKTEDEKNIALCTRESFIKKLQPICVHSIFSLTPFADKEVRSAIHLNKFHENIYAQKLLRYILEQWLVQLPKTEYILIPIPLSQKRMTERGYNQVTNIARGTLKQLPNIKLRTDILKRSTHTVPQTSLSKKERMRNLKGAFSIKSANCTAIRGKDIILLDDVTTTGTTLAEAKATLLPLKPASIICVALAH